MMESLNWSIQTSPVGKNPTVISEFLLNDLGIFVKTEHRMPKKNLLNALTGFRIGYQPAPGTDYRTAPGSRNAILWYKITNILETEPNKLTVSGNQSDVIQIVFSPEQRVPIISYIQEMQRMNPRQVAADETAAKWMCWRDDDEWDEPMESLRDMVQRELNETRYIDPDFLEETVLPIR